ncbi:MAG: CPBP family intramembrane metalloprotease, partial [Acidobacteria bacterium]|nr:CPBP family intramembrane metalloprotease [Acidobacteriota bacterium]
MEAFQEHLKIPEQWQRDFAALRSKNELYSQIAQAFYVALIIAATVVLIGGLRRGEIIWKPVVRFAGAVAALNVLAQWNNLPFFLNVLPTTTGLGKGLVLALLQSAGSGAGIFLYVLIAAVPGLIAYRDLLPGMLHVPAAFSPRAWATREWFRAAWAGLALAAVHLAFVTAFYLIGQRFGVWSPQDVQQSNLLSTFAPWLYPMTTSLLAASSEEFWFRLLAVPLVKRWTGSTWIAIVGPAFVWGFLHANYPQQPGYIRGVEVGIIGVVAGWFMLRFGILATLVWHYTVDAILFSTYLFASDSTGLRLAGLMVSCLALFPLFLTWRSYRAHGGFIVEPAWLNAALPRGSTPTVDTAGEPEPAIPPTLSPRVLYALAAILGVAALWFPREQPGQFARVAATRKDALTQAPAPQPGERQATQFAENLDPETYEYLRQQVGPAEANRILRDRTTTAVWRIRTFAPERKNETLDFVGAGGKHFRRDLILDEKAPGENLTQAQARALAEKYLVETHAIRLDQYQLADAATEKREARTDHTFVWEDRTFRAGEARARLSLDILGNQPSEFQRFLKLPEQWQRDYRGLRIASLILPAAAGGFVFFILGIFIRSLRRAPFRPRRYAFAGLAAAVILLAMEANEWPQFYLGYSTEQPLTDFHGDFVLSLSVRTLLAGGAVFLMAYMLDVLLHILQGDRRTQRLSRLQSAALVITGAGALRIIGAMEHWILGVRHSQAMWSAPPVDAWSPALAVLLNAGLAALIGAMVVPLAVIAAIVAFPPSIRPYYALGVAVGWGLLRGGTS